MSAKKAERELLRPVEDHELGKGGNFWKYFWRTIGALMIIMILSYMLTNYTVRSIIAGRANSDVISGNSLDSNYGSIVFSEESYENLKGLYHANEKEFKACLMGEFDAGNYIITEVFLPKMHFQDYDKVVSSPCPDDTLIEVHSHPQQHCTFSQVDLEGFDPTNENTIMGVMCYEDRFIFYK